MASGEGLRNCQGSSRHTLELLFGSSTLIPSADLPTKLDYFVGCAFGGGVFASVEEVVHRATLFPYLTYFLSETRRKDVVNVMSTGDARGLKTGTGLVANGFGASAVLRSCSVCNDIALQRYGFWAWTRALNLPGLQVCPFHHLPLHAAVVQSRTSNRHDLHLPSATHQEHAKPCGEAVRRVSLAGHPATVAAWYAAAGIQFKSILLDRKKEKENGKAVRVAPHQVNQMTVESARASVMALEVSGRKRPLRLLLHRLPRLMWYLRLNDLDWLKARLGAKRVWRIPSIEEDRNWLTRRFSFDIIPAERRSALTNSAEFVRAEIRDASWLAQELATVQETRNLELRISRAQPVAAWAARLNWVISEQCQSLDKPLTLDVVFRGPKDEVPARKLIKLLDLAGLIPDHVRLTVRRQRPDDTTLPSWFRTPRARGIPVKRIPAPGSEADQIAAYAKWVGVQLCNAGGQPDGHAWRVGLFLACIAYMNPLAGN